MIGIIGAMDEEVAILKESMEVQDMMERAGMTFVKGIMSGKEVVVVRSGIGKVNMGICAQILIDCFGVDTLINTGVAGSLDADINIGDIVISTDAVQHDMDVSMLGDPVGQIPRMDTFSFPADEKLVKLAVEVNKEVNPDIQTFTGRVLSGDQFISGKEKKEYLVKTFDGKCAEMEGAAMAQTAYLNKVSYQNQTGQNVWKSPLRNTTRESGMTSWVFDVFSPVGLLLCVCYEGPDPPNDTGIWNDFFCG